MPKDITITLEDRPGSLADMGEALGKAAINIDGMCGFPCEGKGVIHILVEDAEAARRALEAQGLEVLSEREVLLLEAEDKPGMLGEVTRKIADAGVNVDLIYKATQTTLVIGVDDLEKARTVV
ncbi:MAG: ACT domain-containing protein [Anaerolineales bacterium]|nr:ACT domain-containing protein [Anaerolineales bacterium]